MVIAIGRVGSNLQSITGVRLTRGAWSSIVPRMGLGPYRLQIIRRTLGQALSEISRCQPGSVHAVEKYFSFRINAKVLTRSKVSVLAWYSLGTVPRSGTLEILLFERDGAGEVLLNTLKHFSVRVCLRTSGPGVMTDHSRGAPQMQF